jgi:hypothetical protein
MPLAEPGMVPAVGWPSPPRPAPLSHYVAVILRARLRAAWRRLRRRRFGWVGLGALGLIAVLGALICFGIGAAVGQGLRLGGERLVGQLAALGLPVAVVPLLLPTAVFAAGWFMAFFLTFASLLGVLYLRKELPLLMVAPVPIRAVFLAQFSEALAMPLFWALVLGLSMLVGYGRGLGAGPAYFLWAPLLVVLMPLVPLGVAAIAALVLLRLVPAPRAAEILTVLGALFGVTLWLAVQSMDTLLARLDPSGQALVTGSVGLTQPLLPWAWAARGLLGAAQGDWPAALGYGAAYALLALGVVAGGMRLAERLYYDGFVQGADRGRRRARARAGAPAASGRLPRLLPAPVLAIARKDWRLMRRDPRGFASLIWVLAMLGFLLLRQGGAVAGPSGAPWGAVRGALSVLGGLAPVGAALLLSGLRWGMESISRDQRSFQVLQAAPVPMRQVVLGKWLGAYLPSLALAIFVMAVVSLVTGQTAAWLWARNLAIVAPILAAETAIMLAFGAARPRFDWSDPREMAGGVTGCLGALAAWGFMVVALLLVVTGIAAPALFGLPGALAALGWVAMAALSALVIGVAFTFAGERLAAVEL